MFSRAFLPCGELLGGGGIAAPIATAPLSFEELPYSCLQVQHQQVPELQFLHILANFCSLLLLGFWIVVVFMNVHCALVCMPLVISAVGQLLVDSRLLYNSGEMSTQVTTHL